MAKGKILRFSTHLPTLSNYFCRINIIYKICTAIITKLTTRQACTTLKSITSLFCLMVFQSIHVTRCVSHQNNWCKQSVSQIPTLYAIFLWLRRNRAKILRDLILTLNSRSVWCLTSDWRNFLRCCQEKPSVLCICNILKIIIRKLQRKIRNIVYHN